VLPFDWRPLWHPLGLRAGRVIVLAPEPAAADFRLCNNTTSRVGISMGYKENDGWTTEGWWNLPPRTLRDIDARASRS